MGETKDWLYLKQQVDSLHCNRTASLLRRVLPAEKEERYYIYNQREEDSFNDFNKVLAEYLSGEKEFYEVVKEYQNYRKNYQNREELFKCLKK